MSFAVVENVRGFFGSRPPLVVFMIFLGSMAVGLITFAYIVRVKDMPDSDVAEDWNTFLERLSGLNYCLGEAGAPLSNASQSGGWGFREVVPLDTLKPTAARFVRDLDQGQRRSTVTTTSTLTPANAANVMNVSVVVDVEISLSAALYRFAAAHNYSYITTSLHGSQLGRSGFRQDLEANVTLVLPPLGNVSHHCVRGPCYRVSACATLTAPRQFFPNTQRPDVAEQCLKELDPGMESHLHVEVIPNYVSCLNASYLRLQHRYDPTLTTVTTMDRSAINLHLMHSSYFLFVMVVTLFCYALVKGRPAKVKVVYTQCTSDKHSLNQV